MCTYYKSATNLQVHRRNKKAEFAGPNQAGRLHDHDKLRALRASSMVTQLFGGQERLAAAAVRLVDAARQPSNFIEMPGFDFVLQFL